jgi:serine/threonine protein kinase
MALTSGTRLGPYEIESPLGAGGMGEVYRARDTRLDRTVAIKVLNAQLVASTELRARFEREAKIISQLQHPHICVLHDVGNRNLQTGCWRSYGKTVVQWRKECIRNLSSGGGERKEGANEIP